MGYVPLEKLLDKSNGSLFKLVMLASHRALELAEGMPKLVETSNVNKFTTIALEEVAAGRVHMNMDKLDKEE